MSTGFFGDIDKIRFEGPGTNNPLAFRHYDPDEMVMGKRMEDHLRFAVAYWHSFTWPGTDPFGGQTFERPGSERHDGQGEAQGRRRLRDVRAPRRALLLLPRRRRAAGGRHAGRKHFAARRDRRLFRRQDGEDRRQALVGHGEPVLQPPLHGGRGDQPGPRRLRLRRGDGEELHRRHQAARRRQLRAVGRARGLRDAAQHRYRARARPARPLPRPWWSTTSTRSASRARS